LKRRDQKEVTPTKVTEADVWADQTSETVARAMAAWLKGSVNTQRPINTLKLEEMKLLARVATDAWITEASWRIESTPSEEEKLRLRSLLF
jgi:hypothetical protein